MLTLVTIIVLTQQPGPPVAEPPAPAEVVRFPLLPSGAADRLRLSDEQRQRVRQVEREYAAQLNQLLVRAGFKGYGLINSVHRDDGRGEPAPLLAIAHEVTGGLLEARRLRLRYEEQVRAILSDEQRRAWAEMLAERSAKRGDRRPAEWAEGDGLALLSPAVQRRVRLTPEQVKQVAELRDELEARLRALLTDEQRRSLDDVDRRPRLRDGRNPNRD